MKNMYTCKQGNPRSRPTPNNSQNGEPLQGVQGTSSRFDGSYSNLAAPASFSGTTFAVEPGNNMSTPTFVVRTANNFHPEIRRYRTASSSSDQSYQRRNHSNSNWNGNQRGNQRRANQTTDHATTSNGTNFSSRHKPKMGFKALQNLLEKDSEQLILDLSNSKRGIAEFIQNATEDALVLFVKILKKVADSSFDGTKYHVLQTYLDDIFIDKLVKYIVFLPMQTKQHQKTNRYFWNDPDGFWNSVIGICQDINDSVPTFGRKVLPEILKSLIVCFPSFENQHSRHISDGIKENVHKLNEAVQALIKKYEEEQKVSLEKKLYNKNDEEPPDDFRQISVYPSSLELIGGTQVFLRENVVKGPYRDVNHYLDVQFRLLREDFVGPLRSGIGSYRSERNASEPKKRIENVKIHKKVRFINPETVNEQYCVRLCFDFSKKKKNFKYENSRRFMFGSLLCFTSNNFRSIIFGKVAERKTEDLEKGELIVGFDQNITVEYNIDYLMVEYSVYFEPYYHVLNVLQKMSIDNFPMQKYIIYVDTSVKPPEYLTVPNCTYIIRELQFFPLVNWPTTNFYHLNDSQLQAFQAALTQEFCIIQGPPGTGKTFLGLKIAKTLLENYKAWYQKSPMLVICYTNHALDQFLEGLTEFTSKIVRVGGQSKNEKLSSFNLRNRHRCKMSPAFYEKRDEVKMIGTEIKNVTENFKQINFYNSIRAFDAFEEVVPNFASTWFSRARRDAILDWLLQRSEELPRTGTTQNVNRTEESVDIDSVQGDDNNDEELNKEDSDSENVSDEDHADDLFDELKVMDVQCSIPILTTSSLRQKMEVLQNAVQNLRQNENPTTEQFIEEEKCNFELFKVKNEYDYLNMKLAEGKLMTRVEIPKHIDLNNPYDMSPEDRWKLYFHWLNLYKDKLKEKLNLLNNRFRDVYKIYEEMRDIENTNSMKDALVIGMTTTGAARLRSSLQALKSPVVIVEEAAEVLEAHIVASLTKHCQHLILIGDHQQLKPSTSNYKIERFYKLGISLFERMVINEIQLYTLNIQHRMKPEISSLITPIIYPSLEDHPSVTQREPIRGLDNCLFFIDHTLLEDNCDGTSKKNHHEVEFLIHFAKHLILNGYKPENITILSAYLGQMFEMQKEKKKHRHVLEKVRIAVLDNYQGEECDIILLSLVRSNKENKIGFLSIENRVCVALSRARNGFYIMGNMTQLCAASELWQKIRRTLEEQNAIGTELALRCQVHPDTVTYVKKGDDFLNVSEGGCSQKCGAALVCGHKCTSLCHILNRDHKDYKCRETCNKQLCDADPLHLCKKMCYVQCGPCAYLVQRSLPCGHTVSLECHIDLDTYHCIVPVSTQLPCGHVADKPCHRDAQTYRCPHPCDVKVEPCGHACSLLCHIRRDPDHLEYQCRKKCARYRKGCTMETDDHLCRKFCYEECEPCMIPVRKKRTTCPHLDVVPCSSDVDEITCQKPCTKTLPCNHKCKSKCSEPCRKCELKVEKINSVCGHTIKIKCCEEPDRKLCNKKCPLKLPCGHPCTKSCNEPCTTPCREMVSCLITAPCGHNLTQIVCSMANSINQQPEMLQKYCNHPCRDQLKCGHSCSGTCGECHQGRVHKRCGKKCGFPLVCNHPCSFPCRQACRPCDLPCPFKCKHSSCGKKCGDVCTACKEKCTRSCRHQKCTKFCGQICNVPPCNEPCDKALKCGHRCIGFCGDPCPPKCLICDKQELTTIFFGFEDEEDARFVLLADCRHVFESIGLEQWMKQDEDKIGFKECPGCKTPIKTTQRYNDFIKKSMADVATVKKNFHGTPQEIEGKRQELRHKLLLLKGKCNNLELPSLKLNEVLQTIENRLQVEMNGKRQPINKPVLSAIESKLQIIEHTLNFCEKGNFSNTSSDVCVRQVKFITKFLIRQEDYITEQEIDDIQYELNRLSRIIELAKIKTSPYFGAHFSSSNSVRNKVDQIQELLHSSGKFFDEDEEKVKQLLTDLSRSVASGIGISEKERREIVQAIGLKQGHWYKCPKGHAYAIGDCGRPVQESICPECRAKIGGTSYRLVTGNTMTMI